MGSNHNNILSANIVRQDSERFINTGLNKMDFTTALNGIVNTNNNLSNNSAVILDQSVQLANIMNENYNYPDLVKMAHPNLQIYIEPLCI
jgi:hypothetical protein